MNKWDGISFPIVKNACNSESVEFVTLFPMSFDELIESFYKKYQKTGDIYLKTITYKFEDKEDIVIDIFEEFKKRNYTV